MKAYWRILLLALLATSETAFPITLVYNMRVRRTFSVAGKLRQDTSSIWVPSIVPIFQRRTRHIVTTTPVAVDVTDKRSVGGALINFQVIPTRSYWAEITTGIERESATVKGTTNECAAKSGFDDVLISAGYNFYPIEHGQFTLYGLIGFPTHWKVSEFERFGTFIGTHFFNIAVGAEVSYGFIDTLPRSLDLIAQGRLLHAFSRSWNPILPEGSTIQPGNVSDLLITLQYREKQDIFELSYNPTWFSNQAAILPTTTIKTDTYVRNSGSFSYSHVFRKGALTKKPFIIGTGVNYSHAKFFDTNTFSCWVSFSWVF